VIWLWRDFATAGWFSVFLRVMDLLIRLAAFVVTAASLHRIALKRKMIYPWMAWVPVIRFYLLGQMLGRTLPVTRRLHIPLIGYILPFSSAFSILLSGMLCGSAFAVLTAVLSALAYASLFRQYRERLAVLYGLLAALPYAELIGSILIWRQSDKPVPDPATDHTVFR